jgi:hypothetical protein
VLPVIGLIAAMVGTFLAWYYLDGDAGRQISDPSV